jgi:effector-binding domain-containing protein
MRRSFTYLAIILCLLTVRGFAGMSNVDADAAKPTIGETRVQDLKAFRFCSKTFGTTFDGIKKLADVEIPKLIDAMKTKGTASAGPLVFIYTGVQQDMSKPFKLEIGIMIAKDVPVPDGYQARDVPETHSASLLFTGALKYLEDGYQKLFNSLDDKKLKPTGETREYYLYWEGPESANNVIMITSGVEK